MGMDGRLIRIKTRGLAQGYNRLRQFSAFLECDPYPIMRLGMAGGLVYGFTPLANRPIYIPLIIEGIALPEMPSGCGRHGRRLRSIWR